MGRRLDINENPLAFALLVGAQIVIVAMLSWIAAGPEMVALWRWIAPVAMWSHKTRTSGNRTP